MIRIDGSMGEGGGQVLRSSLALSMITGQPLALDKVRAGRARPGLLRQHLAGLRAAAEISGARVEGDELGSRAIRFHPGKVQGGRYRFAVGSAGSAGLVLQTVLPALMLADRPSELVLEGGTHNPSSPPFDFLQRAFLPLLSRMGPQVRATLQRPGFYPVGGGCFTITIQPAPLRPIEILDRGPAGPLRARAIVSSLPRQVADREMKVLVEKLGLTRDQLEVVEVEDPRGPGNAVMVDVPAPEITEVFTGFGERKKRSEDIAAELAEEVAIHVASGVPVGVHLADQLLLPLALAGGGAYRTTELSLHTTTNMEVIRRFIDIPFRHGEVAPGVVEVRVG